MQDKSEQEQNIIQQFKRQQEKQTKMIRREARQHIFKRSRKDKEQQWEITEVLSLQPIIIQSKSIKPLTKKLIVDPYIANEINEIMDQILTVDYFDQFCQILFSNANSLDLHWAMIGMRRLFCSSFAEEQFHQKIQQIDFVPLLLSFMLKDNYPQLKLQATWILTNLAAWSSLQCQRIVRNNGIQIFTRVLEQNQEGVVEQAIWGIGNLAAENIDYRDKFISLKVVQTVAKFGAAQTKRSMIVMCAHTIANLLRGKPLPQYKMIKEGAIFLCNVIRNNHATHDQCIYDFLYALSYHFKDTEKRIQEFINTNVLPKIIELASNYLKSNNDELFQICLKIFGNITMGTRAQTSYVLKEGIMNILFNSLSFHKKKIRESACWVISNIVAQSFETSQYIIQDNTFMGKLRQIFESDYLSVGIQICYIYDNLSINLTSQSFIKIMTNEKVVQRVIDILKQTEEAHSLQGPLRLLHTLLEKAKDTINGKSINNQIEEKVINYNGILARIQELSNHNNEIVNASVGKIIQNIFKDKSI